MYRLSDLPRLTVAGAFVFLAACAGEPTAPAATDAPSLGRTTASTDEGWATFVVQPGPGAAVMKTFGMHGIFIAPEGICDLSSSYGPTEWNQPCVPASEPITITAHWYVRGNGHPEIDFEPALRFVPGKSSYIWIQDRATVRDDRKIVRAGGELSVLYRDVDGNVIDEAKSDPDLTTYFNGNNVAYRRIKHFSGYLVGAENTVSDAALDQ